MQKNIFNNRQEKIESLKIEICLRTLQWDLKYYNHQILLHLTITGFDY